MSGLLPAQRGLPPRSTVSDGVFWKQAWSLGADVCAGSMLPGQEEAGWVGPVAVGPRGLAQPRRVPEQVALSEPRAALWWLGL